MPCADRDKICASFQAVCDSSGCSDDGRIGREELAAVLRDIDPEVFTDARVRDLLAGAAVGGDDRISFEELVDWIFNDELLAIHMKVHDDDSAVMQFVDGRMRATFIDGCVVDVLSGGVKREANADGSVVISSEGRATTALQPDGACVTTYLDGSTVRTSACGGVTRVTLGAGWSAAHRSVQGRHAEVKEAWAEKPEVTARPRAESQEDDNCRSSVDAPSVDREPDGTLVESFPSGYSRRTAPDGTIVMKNATSETTVRPNGTAITRYAGGNVVQTSADGTTISIHADGRRTHVDARGIRIIDVAEGLTTAYLRNGTVVESFSAEQALATGVSCVQRSANGLITITYTDNVQMQFDQDNGEAVDFNILKELRSAEVQSAGAAKPPAIPAKQSRPPPLPMHAC
mmetsp:Transcript_14609/g.31953  ORF Transcript_14609/g.31953 Transcript_14609/m.31953 type:complete len:402 (+) Transcript_14609:96-1301(+)